VTPGELRDELVGLGGDIVYKQTYKKAVDDGVAPFLAKVTANGAKSAAEELADVVSFPVVKALDIDRLQNNVTQLFDGVGHDGERIWDDGGDAWDDATSGDFTGVVLDAGDALDAAGDAGKTVISKGVDVLESAGDFLNPWN
jgi:hypothetical protein